MIKTLLLDVETSYSIVATFSLWPKSIPHDNILKDWHIICAAWKWADKQKVYGAVTYNNDDAAIVEALREAIIEADEIVYHNGRKFDFKKINTRVLLNGLDPMPKPKEIDTLLQVKKHFGFTSNRLDYLGKALDVGGKAHSSNELWLNALKYDRKAIKALLKYCKQDVRVLEAIYNKMKHHIDYGVNKNLSDLRGDTCPDCNSINYHARGYIRTKACKYQRFQCQDCGRWFHDGKKLNTRVVQR